MIDVLLPEWQGAAPTVGALATVRAGGVSTGPYGDGAGGYGLNLGTHVGDDPAQVARNRALLRNLLPSEPVWLSQVHGADVVDAAGVDGVPDADASFTTQPGVVCAVQTADCLPVLLCDAAGKVVGAAHGGWRGLAAGVLQNTVRRMRDAGAGEVLAWLGPAIGPRHFEVGPEVRDAFIAGDARAAQAFEAKDGGKFLADIYQLARLALHSVGVECISGGGFCTVAEERRFYSYRRDRVTGRMATLIWIPSQA
jgi:YfiH family protein